MRGACMTTTNAQHAGLERILDVSRGKVMPRLGRTALATTVVFISQWFGWCGADLSAMSPGPDGPKRSVNATRLQTVCD